MALGILHATQIEEVLRIQPLSPVDGAMIRILQQPHITSAFGEVKVCHRPEDFEENILLRMLAGSLWNSAAAEPRSQPERENS